MVIFLAPAASTSVRIFLTARLGHCRAPCTWSGMTESWSLDDLATYYRSASVAYRDWDGTSAGELLGVCTVGLNCDPINGGVAQQVTRLVSVNEVLRTSTTIEHLTEEVRFRRHTERLDWMVGAQEVLAREHDGDGLGVAT